MTEDNELIAAMADAIIFKARNDYDELIPTDVGVELARAALTAYRNHQVEL